MSGPRLAIEPHNPPRIGDLGGGRYLTIPPRVLSDAVTINSVSRESGAVQDLPDHRLWRPVLTLLAMHFPRADDWR